LMKRHAAIILYSAFCTAVVFFVQAGWISAYAELVAMYIGINIILSASLNLVNGYMGEFSCGHAGFMAVGAYVSSIMSTWLFTPGNIFGDALLGPGASVYLFPFTLLAGGLCAAMAGLFVAVPSFKTRGDYLAIITLASNYIVKSAIENIQIIGGARGFMGMRKAANAMSETFPLPWLMIWILVFTGFTIVVLRRFVGSIYGKGVMAVRDDEIAAEMMSVDTRKMKLAAFMLSSGLAGIAGGLFAHVLGYINPGSFTIMKSTEIMVMVYLGGMGSLSGSVVSAILFTLLMEALRPLQVLKWVLIPLFLIILMLFRPEGIMGNRELSHIFPILRRFSPAGKEV
jgi:branched-chain amino acid transport system permease protein